MSWKERIAVDPDVLTGKPVIRGTRIAAEFVIDLLAQGWRKEDITENYPGITDEDIKACLDYASELMPAERVFPIAS
jgi:uncharacterized protein (DUF433 family)